MHISALTCYELYQCVNQQGTSVQANWLAEVDAFLARMEWLEMPFRLARAAGLTDSEIATGGNMLRLSMSLAQASGMPLILPNHPSIKNAAHPSHMVRLW
jgi:predicted nucleic acid-binding protein